MLRLFDSSVAPSQAEQRYLLYLKSVLNNILMWLLQNVKNKHEFECLGLKLKHFLRYLAGSIE